MERLGAGGGRWSTVDVAAPHPGRHHRSRRCTGTSGRPACLDATTPVSRDKREVPSVLHGPPCSAPARRREVPQVMHTDLLPPVHL